MRLVEEPKFDFAGWKTFSNSEDEIAFNQQFVDRINTEALKSGVDIYIKPLDSDDTDRYDKKSGYWVVYRAALNEEGEILLKLLNTRNDKILTYKFSGFYKTEDKTAIRYYLVPAQVAIKKIVDEYINDKKTQKAEVRSRSFQGARAVNSLSPEERQEALDWFSENISSINIKYPTGKPTYTKEEGALSSNDPNVIKLAKKFANLDFKFHNDFGVYKDTTEGYLDSYKKVHFEARDAGKIQEKTIVYYNMYWGLSCDIYFKDSLQDAPGVVIGLIAQAKKDSAEDQNNVNDFKQEDKKISSIFLCYAIKELVNDDWDELSKIKKPEDDDDTFNQDFDAINAYGEKVESLREAKEETCCICGEPIKGFGNNPEPYRHSGRCCDACNIKFVIPARLMVINNEEE